MRDTPSPPNQETRTQHDNSDGAAFSTPTEPFRELPKWGPKYDWKPYNWPDSRHKYPGCPVFPEPEDGFSKDENESFYHLRAVMDWWQGHNYTTQDLVGWVNKALQERREYEILQHWVMDKLPPGMHLSVDVGTLGEGFEELVERGKALRVEGVGESIEGVKGEERLVWKFREVEVGESADLDK